MVKYKRINIIDLKNNHASKFGRFMMALKNLENSNDWYRICGIHGNNFKPNDKKVLCPTDPEIVAAICKTGEPFYCKHQVYSFIAWHTPYLYQFELLLNKYNKSKNKKYITLPYIDLTNTNDDFSFFNQDKIKILYDNKNIIIDNPLFASNVFYYEDGVKTRVKRNGFFTPKTERQKMTIEVIKKQLNNTLYAETYEKFSSLPVSKSSLKLDNLYIPIETPHNSIHLILGGAGGNMSDVSIAAFDPIFWLHHCNMDRYFYTWLYKNTNKFKKELSSEKITEQTSNLTMAPFFNSCIYSTDYNTYKYGWLNEKIKYMLLKDMLKFDKYQFTYDIILEKSSFDNQTLSFVELKDIVIPIESTCIDIYIHKNTEILNKEKDYVGTEYWFGINRMKLNCSRCNSTRANFKIDIDDFVKKHSITKDNISDYNVVIEGEGCLIKEGAQFKLYNHSDIIKDGLIKTIIN